MITGEFQEYLSKRAIAQFITFALKNSGLNNEESAALLETDQATLESLEALTLESLEALTLDKLQGFLDKLNFKFTSYRNGYTPKVIPFLPLPTKQNKKDDQS